MRHRMYIGIAEDGFHKYEETGEFPYKQGGLNCYVTSNLVYGGKGWTMAI